MTTASILTRLRIRNAADDADLLVITSEAGGTNPYLEDRAVSADGQSVDPLTGQTTVGAYVIPVIDVEGSTTVEVVVWQEDFGAYANDAAFTAVWTGDDDPQNIVTFALSTEKVNPAAKSVKVTDTGNAASGSGVHGYRTRVVGGLDPGTTYHYYRRIYDTGRWPSLTDNAWSVVQGADRVADGSGNVTIEIGWITAGAGAVDTDDHYEGDVWLTTDYPTTGRVVTSVLADDAGRLQVLGHRAYYEENVDAGGWDVLVAGFVTDIDFPDALRCNIHVGEAERIEQTTDLFQTLDRSYTEPSCVLGGPVVGGFALVPDYGRPIFEVASVSASSHVVLKYVSGPLPPSYTRSGGLLASVARQMQAANILNAAAAPLAVPSEDYTPTRLWVYPDLGVELYAVASGTQVTTVGAQRGVAGIFTPISRSLSTWTAVLVSLGFLEGVGRELAWNGLQFAVDWATSQPSVGARYSVLLYGLRVSRLAPFHVSGHPVDIADAIYTAFGITTDSTTKAATRAALGPDLWVNLRPTAPTKAATVLQDWLFGPFGFATRVGLDGEREYFATRYRAASDPSETITAADLQGEPTDPWRVSESSICNTVVWTQEKYRGASVPGEGADVTSYADRPMDGLEQANYTLTIASAEDIAETVKPTTVTYEIPGQIGNPATGGLVEDVDAYVEALATDLFARYGRGNPEQTLACLRGVDAQVGEYAIVNLDHLPVAVAGGTPPMRRGGAKVVQVVQRTPAPGGPTLVVRDAGPLVAGSPTPLTPTLSIAATAAYAKKQARVTVTNASAFTGTQDRVRLEYGVGASEPSAFQLLAYVGSTGLTYRDTPLLNAGTRVWARARLERSTSATVANLGPYGAVVNVDLADLTAPSSLLATAYTTSAATLTWTVGETTQPVVVEYKDQADSAWTRAAKLPPGAASYLLSFPAASTDYDIRVYHEEAAPSSGQSAADTETYTTGVFIQLAPPLYPAASSGNGIARLTVTAALGGTALSFEVAVETAAGSGSYGTAEVYATLVAANAGDQVSAELTAPQDGKLYALRARHVAEGYTASAYTDYQYVDPWEDVAEPPVDPPGPVGENLLVNGDAEQKRFVNWAGAPATWVRTNADSADGEYCWEVSQTGGNIVESDQYIPVDVLGSVYEILGKVKKVSDNAGPGKTYIGLSCYDHDKVRIKYEEVYAPNGLTTVATLAADLNGGDTTIQLNDASTFTADTNSYCAVNCEDDGSDIPNREVFKFTGKSSNDLTGATVPGTGLIATSGTKVRFHRSGAAYTYTLIPGALTSDLPTDWTEYRAQIGSYTIAGLAPTANTFRVGTAFVRFLILGNNSSVATGDVVRFDSLAFRRTDELLYTLYEGPQLFANGAKQAGSDGSPLALVKGRQSGWVRHGQSVTFVPAFGEPPSVRLFGGIYNEPRPVWGSKLNADPGWLILSATAASPIAVTTVFNHGLSTGNKVLVWQVGDTAPGLAGLVGYHTITVTGLGSFTLDSSSGTGTYNAGSCAHTQGQTAVDTTIPQGPLLEAEDLTASGFTAVALLRQQPPDVYTGRSVNGAGISTCDAAGETDPVDLGSNVPSWSNRYLVDVRAYIEARGKTAAGTATHTMAIDSNDGSGWVERIQFTHVLEYGTGSTATDSDSFTQVLAVTGLGANDDIRVRWVSLAASTATTVLGATCGIATSNGITWETSSNTEVYANKTPNGQPTIYWEAEGVL